MTTFRVESGLQMLARLTKRPNIENCYSNIFKEGLKQGHVIEFFSDGDFSNILCDLICELIMPLDLGSPEAGVIIFNSDGNIDFNILENLLKKKLSECCQVSELSNFNCLLENALKNIFILDIYDATQLHSTIQTLDSILINHPSISMIVFDTLTAFYWSEQSFKITKMDLYIKNLLKIIQNVVKDYKVTLLYTRPQYFSSNKEIKEMVNPCSEPLNYRIQIVYNEDETHQAIVQTHSAVYTQLFKMVGNDILWL